jgi:hypothetical protein
VDVLYRSVSGKAKGKEALGGLGGNAQKKDEEKESEKESESEDEEIDKERERAERSKRRLEERHGRSRIQQHLTPKEGTSSANDASSVINDKKRAKLHQQAVQYEYTSTQLS